MTPDDMPYSLCVKFGTNSEIFAQLQLKLKSQRETFSSYSAKIGETAIMEVKRLWLSVDKSDFAFVLFAIM
jgi:hypothetical protein